MTALIVMVDLITLLVDQVAEVEEGDVEGAEEEVMCRALSQTTRIINHSIYSNKYQCSNHTTTKTLLNSSRCTCSRAIRIYIREVSSTIGIAPNDQIMVDYLDTTMVHRPHHHRPRNNILMQIQAISLIILLYKVILFIMITLAPECTETFNG